MGEVYRADDLRLGQQALVTYLVSGPVGPRLLATAYQVASTAVVLLVLLRIGIFASAVMFAVNFMLLRVPLTFDGRALYSTYAWLAIAGVLLLAAAGFRMATAPGTAVSGGTRLPSS